ncbi:MAG: hypothetical protein EAZ95_00530 [Bacteroidetes bacterium]|nr:MAG: hypothetical protein EAZ95_00530 [Bacteroidota bacterium]
MQQANVFFSKFRDFLPDDVYLSYYGEIDNTIIASLGIELRRRFSNQPGAFRKLFGVYMELVQNIGFYAAIPKSASLPEPTGLVLITDEGEFFSISSGNFTRTSSIKKLQEKCDYINSLTMQELRKYRAEIVDRPTEEGSRGAGVGLVKIALMADAPLEVDVPVWNEVEDLALYCIKVKVKKESK